MIYMINPHKNRFYWIMLQQDLFGTWCIIKVYGGLHNNHCHKQVIAYPNEELALQALSEIESIRRARGYEYSSNYLTDYFHLKPQTLTEVLNKN